MGPLAWIGMAGAAAALVPSPGAAVSAGPAPLSPPLAHRSMPTETKQQPGVRARAHLTSWRGGRARAFPLDFEVARVECAAFVDGCAARADSRERIQLGAGYHGICPGFQAARKRSFLGLARPDPTNLSRLMRYLEGIPQIARVLNPWCGRRRRMRAFSCLIFALGMASVPASGNGADLGLHLQPIGAQVANVLAASALHGGRVGK